MEGVLVVGDGAEHFQWAAQVPNPKMDEVGTHLGVHPDFALSMIPKGLKHFGI